MKNKKKQKEGIKMIYVNFKMANIHPDCKKDMDILIGYIRRMEKDLDFETKPESELRGFDSVIRYYYFLVRSI